MEGGNFASELGKNLFFTGVIPRGAETVGELLKNHPRGPRFAERVEGFIEFLDAALEIREGAVFFGVGGRRKRVSCGFGREVVIGTDEDRPF